jgi:hypothetical protein
MTSQDNKEHVGSPEQEKKSDHAVDDNPVSRPS